MQIPLIRRPSTINQLEKQQAELIQKKANEIAQLVLKTIYESEENWTLQDVSNGIQIIQEKLNNVLQEEIKKFKNNSFKNWYDKS